MERGRGTLIEFYVDGSPSGIYEGQWSSGKLNGPGRVIQKGAIYRGSFKEGRFDGHGVYVWAGGKKYVGKYFEGFAAGKGELSWPDGTRYQGHFLRN